MKSLNLGLSFLLELCLLGAYGFWGFQMHGGAAQWLFGIGTPVIVAVIWGIFFAPKSTRRLANPLRMILELVVFGIGALALGIAGQPQLALIFAGLVIINFVLMIVWKQ